MNTYQLKCAINHDCNMRNAICDVHPADEIPHTIRMCKGFIVNKGNNKITELQTILQRESQSS